LAVGTEDVGPLQGPKAGEVVAIDELIDEFIPLVRGGVLIEGLNFLEFGESAGGVEVGAAEEFLVGGEFRGEDLHRLKFGEDEVIDEVLFGRIVPGETGDVFEEGDVAGGHLVEVASKDG